MKMLFPACFKMPDLFADRDDRLRLALGGPGEGKPMKLLFWEPGL